MPLFRYFPAKTPQPPTSGTINMHTDLLETPDIYWEHPRLEELYHMVSREMDIVSRVACTNR